MFNKVVPISPLFEDVVDVLSVITRTDKPLVRKSLAKRIESTKVANSAINTDAQALRHMVRTDLNLRARLG